jgi:hypothetical protein
MSTIERPATRLPSDDVESRELLVSVVIPCLNEEENIELCVRTALDVLEREGIPGEVVVADNASTDGSAVLAAAAGAHVVHEPRRGYGSAYLAGFAAARGKYIVMGDADLTYDFAEIPNFVRKLEDGAELVMGDRMDNIRPGAMPWLHQYVGNPVLSGSSTSSSRPASATRTAACARCAATSCRGWTCARRGWSSPRRWSSGPARSSSPSPSSRSSTTRAAASPSSRRSGTAGATCGSCSSTRPPTCS